MSMYYSTLFTADRTRLRSDKPRFAQAEQAVQCGSVLVTRGTDPEFVDLALTLPHSSGICPAPEDDRLLRSDVQRFGDLEEAIEAGKVCVKRGLRRV